MAGVFLLPYLCQIPPEKFANYVTNVAYSFHAMTYENFTGDKNKQTGIDVIQTASVYV